MKKRALSLALALTLSFTAAAGTWAMTEQETAEDIAWTSMQLDAAYARIDQLWEQKQELEYQISSLNADLVNVMVSIDVLKNDIAVKQQDIEKTSENLDKAVKAKDQQYESMKDRIQYLYENGGDDAWFQMLLNAENLSDLLNRAEYTQKMFEEDRAILNQYVNTATEVQNLKDTYESEKAELEEMEAAYEEQSAVLQYQIEVMQASSADCSDEIAYMQNQASEYANWLVYQQNELIRLQNERIAYEEAMRRQAEQEAAEMAAYYAENGDGQTEEGVKITYDENGDAYDQYGNWLESESLSYIEANGGDTSVAAAAAETAASTGSTVTTSYSGSGQSVVDFATQFVGNPYVYGGTSLTNGADCSGFVQSVYSNFGVSLPRTSYEQQNAGYEVSYADAQPGDLICYGGHVAIYMGNGRIVHASNSRDGIKISENAQYRTITSVRRLV